MKKPLSVLLSLTILILAGSIPLPVQADNSTLTSYQDEITKSATRYYYLSEWIGTGRMPDDTFQPAVSEYTPNWTVIDLRQDSTKATGYGIVATDGLLEIKGDKRIILICNGVDLNSELTGSVKNVLSKALNVTVKGLSLPEVISNLLADLGAPLAPEVDGKVRLSLKGQIAGEAPTPVGHTTITDNFTRANQTPLGSSSEGWSWTTISGTYGVVSNQAKQLVGGGSITMARANTDLGSPDMYAQCSTQNDADVSGVAVRKANTSNATYYSGAYVTSNTVKIYKCINGTTTSLKGPTAASYGAGRILKLQVNGSTLTIYYNGSSIDSVSDTSITTGNYSGLFCYESNTIQDLFEASSLTVAKAITNTPSSKAMGVVTVHSTGYTGGGAYSNPVTDGQCNFTITNTGSSSCDLSASMTDWTASGGNTWNVVSTSPDGDEIRVTLVYSGQDPASGLVLANSSEPFYSGLAASGTLKWDLKLEFGGDNTTGFFSDGKLHTGTITLTAS